MIKQKINILLGLICFGLNIIAAQVSTEQIHEKAEQMPYFPGCDFLKNGSIDKRNCSNQNFVNYLSSKLQYPEKAKKAGLEGAVYVSFVVDQNGYVKYPKIIRDIGEGCGEEAIRMLETMPAWEPARNQNQPVSVKLNVKVHFSLSAEEKDHSEDYTISWGLLKGNSVSKAFLLKNFQYPIAVRDQFGHEVNVNELSFLYQKKSHLRQAKSNGNISRAQIQLLKKIRKGGNLTISAIVQEKGQFVTIARNFSISK